MNKYFEKVKTLLFPPYEMTENEKLINDIVDLMINAEGTYYKVAPVSNSYFIVNDDLGYVIKISYSEIKVINHSFLVNGVHTRAFHDIMMDKVSQCIEEDRNTFEKQVFRGEIDILNKIINQLSKKK